MITSIRIGRALLILGDWQGDRHTASRIVRADAIVTDPPYGIGYKVNERAKAGPGALLKATKETETQAVDVIAGDDKPFDPRPLLSTPKLALFGAQHFSHKLPRGRWLVWDKRRESKPDDHSDGELIWMTGDSTEALRIHRQKWRGVVREGEENCSRSKKLHPNQKPVALLTVILDHLGLVAGQTVADPYMGSGSTGIAALRASMNFIGCEIDAAHFETARARIAAEFGEEVAA